MSWAYLADWDNLAAGSEIEAEYFEDIRKLCWALQHISMLDADGEWTPPAEFSPTYSSYIQGQYRGYLVGQTVMYNDEIYICSVEQPSANNAEPPGSGWKLGVDERKYSHYNRNANRWKFCGSVLGLTAVLVESYKFYPRQLDPTKQACNAYEWKPRTLYYADDLIIHGSSYYRSDAKHISEFYWSDELANLTAIAVPDYDFSSAHREPVEFDFDYITGDIGATIDMPHEQPTPPDLNYHHSQIDEPYIEELSPHAYYNSKVSEAYQAFVEYICNSWAGSWTGPNMLDTDEQKNYRAGHYLGNGIDPSGDYITADGNGKKNWGFNHSAFEEILYLCGNYDWYLDEIYPPEIFGGENPEPVACWRRTWRYGMKQFTVMWPSEAGYPPEPSTDWTDQDAVDTMKSGISLSAANIELLRKRHTCIANPSDGEPELFTHILTDMKAALEKLLYKRTSITIQHKTIPWGNFALAETARVYNSFGACEGAFFNTGEWVIPASWDGASMMYHGFNATIGKDYLDPETPTWGATPDIAVYEMGEISGYYPCIEGWASRWKAYNDTYYAKVGARDVICRIGIRGTHADDDVPATGPGYSLTEFHMTTEIEGVSQKANNSGDDDWVWGDITIPLKLYDSADGADFYPAAALEWITNTLLNDGSGQFEIASGKCEISVECLNDEAMIEFDPMELSIT